MSPKQRPDTTGRPPRIVGLVRVSTAQQVAEGTSLATQTDRITARCKAEGWTLVDIIEEAGVSGAATHRPGYETVMAMARAGTVDAVMVTALDRFGRSARQLLAALGELDDLNIRFISLRESLDSSTPIGRLLRTILVALAEMERELIRERTSAGIAATARAGNWPGGPAPYGYRIVREPGGPARLQPELVETAALLRAIELIVDDACSGYQAAAILNSEGMLPRKSARWTHNGLRRTLRSSVGISGKQPVTTADGTVIINIPPIVTNERHQALITRLDETGQLRPRRTPGPAYLLTGRLTCTCGRPMFGVTRKDRPTIYRCADNRSDCPTMCRAGNLDADMIETRVWGEAAALLSDPHRLAEFAGIAAQQADSGADTNAGNATVIAKKIARIEKALGERIATLYAQGRSDGVIAAATAALEADLERLTAQHQQILAWETTNRGALDKAAIVAKLAANAARNLKNPTVEQRRRIIELLDIEVTVTARHTCPTCAGKGVVLDMDAPARGAWNGRGAPATCPTCRRLRKIPTIAISGVIPASTSHGTVEGTLGTWRIVS